MKTINKYFMCSDDAIYSLTNERMCNVSKGEVRTKSSDAIIFAIDKNTSAHADHAGCHVHAAHAESSVFANASGSSAYALVKDSIAHATIKGAIAHSTCIGGRAICENGGITSGKF